MMAVNIQMVLPRQAPLQLLLLLLLHRLRCKRPLSLLLLQLLLLLLLHRLRCERLHHGLQS
jgi:hypothetical protein